MPSRKTLQKGTRKVPTYRQETLFYCGPATAKMMLRWLKVTRSQTQLWDTLQDEADAQGLPTCEMCDGECEKWFSHPEAMATVLARLGKAPFKLIREATSAAVDHALVWSIVNDLPGAALVYNFGHWVVVHGYHADREPADIDDTSYELLGFDVIDSDPEEKARQFIDAAEWRATYMTGVTCGRFTGQFVAVCDPEPPRMKGGPTVPHRTSTAKGERLMPLERAAMAALDGIQRAGLLRDDQWRRAMAGTRPGSPWLVHRLDRPRTFYALVPFLRSKIVTAEALVDVQSGAMLAARAAESPGRTLRVPMSPSAVLDRLVGTRVDLPGARPQLLLRREGLTISPTLVWKPCAQSLTPYRPFVRVNYGEYTFYVDSNGKVVPALTRAPGGS